jgi:hypothetical protein
VNGDGYSDVIVGAPLYDAGQRDEGAAFVFLGTASGISDARRVQLRLSSSRISVPRVGARASLQPGM